MMVLKKIDLNYSKFLKKKKKRLKVERSEF